MEHRTMDELMADLEDVNNSPQDEGVLAMIVVRPKTNGRVILGECHLSAVSGADGDVWATGSWKKLPDGSSDPVVQISVMNSRSINLLTGDKSSWPLAGDNLYVDFDLGEDNIKQGDRISIGEVMLEVTPQPHTACAKFAERFGVDANKLVNSDTGKKYRLRGIYTKVIRDGYVRVGDKIKKTLTKGCT